MSKHIPPSEQPLKAPPHGGSSKGKAPQAPDAAVSQRSASPDAAASLSRADEPAPLTNEQISVRAYEIWLERGKPEGTDRENWIEAERQLQQRHTDPQKATTPIHPSR